MKNLKQDCDTVGRFIYPNKCYQMEENIKDEIERTVSTVIIILMN